MATIALYADRINQMPDLIRDAKKAVDGLRSQLDILKRKCEAVDTSVCDLDDVISTISASTDTQDEKTAMLETFGENVDQLARDASVIDDAAADRINQEKDDFYDQYSYLKPDCEKSGWEKFCDGCKKVGQWCKEHWESIVTVVVAVIAAVAIVVMAVLTFGAAAVILTAFVGAVVGMLGQVLSDSISFIKNGLTTGKWKWPGTLEDYVGAAFGGAIGGILTLTGIAPLACGVDGAMTTLFTEGLKGITGKSEKSLAEIWLEATIDGATAAVFSKVFEVASDSISKQLSKNIPVLSRLSGRNSYSASYKMVITKLKNKINKHFTWKTVRNGVVSGLTGDVIKNILTGFGVMDVIKDGAKSIILDTLPALPRLPILGPIAPITPIVQPIPGIRLLPMRCV